MRLPAQQEQRAPCRVLVFDEKTRHESTLFAMQTTLSTPHVLLLVGSKLSTQQSE